MRFAELVASSRAVAETGGRLRKIELLASLLQRVPPGEIEMAIAFLAGSPRQGRVRAGGTSIGDARAVVPAETAALELTDVDAQFDRLASSSGSGSARTRGELLRDLFRRSTADEQDFLARLLFGELRQGALESALVAAVARASGIAVDRVRRATMLAGRLAPVARAALVDGEAALARFLLQPFRPLQPMLADSAADPGAAIAALGEAALEYKLDGARIQVHKVDDEVKVYSRNLRDVTIAVPEVASAVRVLPAREIVLDGEAMAFRSDGTPHPFQVTMRRFSRKRGVDQLQQDLPITPVFFDALYVDGAVLIDEPLARRAAVLRDRVPDQHLVPRIVTASAEDAAAFAARAIGAGHEGVMAKSLTGTYAAGRRGSAWLKVKEARSLDLVVLAAEWGSGRRRGTLSNLHLGARDAERGGFVMLGKTFKGLTDDTLAWQTQTLLSLEIGRDDYTVYVRPELVVEIAFNDIQASPQYPGRLALRFARVKRYRSEKPATEADTFETICAIYRQTTGGEPPPR